MDERPAPGEYGGALTTTIDIGEAQSHLSELVAQVLAGGEVVLTEGATPVARLVPMAVTGQWLNPSLSTGNIQAGGGFNDPPVTEGDRVPGRYGAVAWISEDFDDPLPDEFWAGGS